MGLSKSRRNQTQNRTAECASACAQAKAGELKRERNSCLIHVAGSMLMPEGMWRDGGRDKQRGGEGGSAARGSEEEKLLTQ